MIYFLGLMGMKICVLIIFVLAPWISRVGDWALRWTEGDEVLQVIFVMLVFPVIMNATQYYIIDSFIKNQKPQGHERIPDNDDDSTFDERDTAAYEVGYQVDGSSEDEVSEDEDQDPEIQAKAKLVGLKPSALESARNKRNSGMKIMEPVSADYDPMYDGESSPTVLGSSSTTQTDRQGHSGSEEEEAKK